MPTRNRPPLDPVVKLVWIGVAVIGLTALILIITSLS